jgi:type III secretion system chaperone SycN
MAGFAKLNPTGKTIMPHRGIVQEFSQRLGIGHFEHGASGPVTFELQGLGSLTLESSADEMELLITLAVPLPPYDAEKLLAALKMCYPDRIRPFPLACGMYKDTLLLVSRREIAGLNAAEVENQALFLLACAKELGI